MKKHFNLLGFIVFFVLACVTAVVFDNSFNVFFGCLAASFAGGMLYEKYLPKKDK